MNRATAIMDALVGLLTPDDGPPAQYPLQAAYTAQGGRVADLTGLTVTPWERELNIKVPGLVIELGDGVVEERVYGGGPRYTISGSVHCLALSDKRSTGPTVALINRLVDACLSVLDQASRTQNSHWLAMLVDGPVYGAPQFGDVLTGAASGVLYTGEATFRIITR